MHINYVDWNLSATLFSYPILVPAGFYQAIRVKLQLMDFTTMLITEFDNSKINK